MVTIHGVLSNGMDYTFTLPSAAERTTAVGIDSNLCQVGKQVEGGYWVKGLLPSGELLLVKKEQYNTINQIVNSDKLPLLVGNR